MSWVDGGKKPPIEYVNQTTYIETFKQNPTHLHQSADRDNDCWILYWICCEIWIANFLWLCSNTRQRRSIENVEWRVNILGAEKTSLARASVFHQSMNKCYYNCIKCQYFNRKHHSCVLIYSTLNFEILVRFAPLYCKIFRNTTFLYLFSLMYATYYSIGQLPLC